MTKGKLKDEGKRSHVVDRDASEGSKQDKAKGIILRTEGSDLV